MNKEYYQCSECGLHYEDRETAQRCAAWCEATQSCNLEITKLSIENQKLVSKEQREPHG